VGNGVKLCPLFESRDKEYIATVKIGEETDTLDPEGAVIADGPLPSREKVEAVLGGFMGEILQAPPEYSAIHINGRRAHELAREGKAPKMEKRPVTIHAMEILSWSDIGIEAVLRVHCSAGTYIRSLARDIALAAGSRAHLSALKRTKVGSFRLEDAASGEGDELLNALRPLDRKLFADLSLQCFTIGEKQAESFVHGRALEEILAENEIALAANMSQTAGVFRKTNPGEEDILLGVIERKNNKWSYGHVFTNH
jgi:tRNA pseudouridine55 synthase